MLRLSAHAPDRLSMGPFLFKRLLTFAATLAGASVVVFLVLEILPGNAAQVMMGPDASPEAVEALAARLGLDQPAPLRYVQWIGGLLSGDMGTSLAYGTPVRDLVLERLALTVPLAVMAMAITTVLALLAGVYAASRHRRWGDVGVMGLAQIGIAIPNFWFAILLILLFSVKLQWFSAGGFPAGRKHRAAVRSRRCRRCCCPQCRWRWCRPPSSRASRAPRCWRCCARISCARPGPRGLSRRSALWGHVLRNAMIPVVTVMGLQFANLLAGTIVVENVFYLPGLGRLIFQSIANRDLVVVRNCVMLLAAMVIVVNFAVDLLYAAIDPRVKASGL